MSGVVYFLRSGANGPIKIGFTTSIERRVASLQTAHPYRLEMIGTVPGTARDEGRAHASLAKHRLMGEWFEPVEAVHQAIGEWIQDGSIPGSLPDPKHTPLRVFRIPESEYRPVQEKIKRDSRYASTTALVREIIREYVEEDND